MGNEGGDPVETLLDLADPRASDPAVAGSKGAWLARAMGAGLSVLPGVVVSASDSRTHLNIGADALGRRGSGGARLEVSQTPLDPTLSTDLVSYVSRLGDPLVVRSSSVLEDRSEWSGAFTSYLDVHPDEVPRAVTGCWASAFGVSTLERHRVAETRPESNPMAVIVQRALDPEFGGVAHIEDDHVVITSVKGSPAPLVQGWAPGNTAKVPFDGEPKGEGAIDLMGIDNLRLVSKTLLDANDLVGSTQCEWAIEADNIYLLQLMRLERMARESPSIDLAGLDAPRVLRIASLSRRFPGPLGETLVLPWAVGTAEGFLQPIEPLDIEPRQALTAAMEHAAALTAQVWSLPKTKALTLARRTLEEIRGPNPVLVLQRIADLHAPDPDRATNLLRLLATVRTALEDMGAVTWASTAWHLDIETIDATLGERSAVVKPRRIGFDRWEPFQTAVTMAAGSRHAGDPAAPGIASGRFCLVPDSGTTDRFRPRDVVVARHPTPNLAPLLWDAAGLVTTGGGRGAHLFESARALAIPAVCAVSLEEVISGLKRSEHDLSLAVDGTAGVVYTREW